MLSKKRARKPVCAALLVCASCFAAGATTVTYMMEFEGQDGNLIGHGAFSYDDAVVEDLYIDDRDRQCDPGDLFCNYYGSWTPVTSISAEIQGVDIFAYGSDTQLWLEGSYSYHGRYEIGGYEPGNWFIGDIYFGQSQLSTSPPPPGASTFTTAYYFTSIDLQNYGVSGNVTYSLAAVPLPATGLTLGISLLGLGAFMRRKQGARTRVAQPG